MTPSRKPAPGGATAKWLTIVGIGEDGAAGLSSIAAEAVSAAEHVFGGARHLELAAPLIRGKPHTWPSPFDATMSAVTALRGQSVCVLASGDPFLHGVGATLARQIDADEMSVHPAPSALSLAAAWLGWPLHDVETASLHGRPVGLIRPLLHPGRRVIALTSDGTAPAAIAAFVTRFGFGRSRFHVLEALGGPGERVVSCLASEVGQLAFDPLNVVAIEVVAVDDAAVVPLAAGLDDALFEHDGQITKREIRAVTLSALAPRRGELLWDIGAGSGSISIAWMLAHPSMRAIAIEARPDRAERIRRNADTLGVPGLVLVEGAAPDVLTALPVPDAIFVGGGGSAPGVMDAAIAALRGGGRLVANAVTVEMETVLATLHARLGGDLTRIAIGRAEPVGTMTGWRPALPVTQWTWTKK